MHPILLAMQEIDELHATIAGAKESRNNETKSSAGDKYETGRAMVQMEIEKNQAQLAQTEKLRNSLSTIHPKITSSQVEFGSVVVTNCGNYFFAIPFGKLEINELLVFVLSLGSPIGKAMAGKTVGEKIVFQGKAIEITDVF